MSKTTGGMVPNLDAQQWQSQTIESLRFPLAVSVVFLHTHLNAPAIGGGEKSLDC